MRTTEHSIKERSVRRRQHLPPRSLGEQQCTRAVHITLTLHEVTLSSWWALSRNDPRVTATKRPAISLRVRRYRMMGLPRCPRVSTLAGTRCDRVANGLHAPGTCACHAERQQRRAPGTRRQRKSGSEDSVKIKGAGPEEGPIASRVTYVVSNMHSRHLHR
jgi:hypothetical protein